MTSKFLESNIQFLILGLTYLYAQCNITILLFELTKCFYNQMFLQPNFFDKQSHLKDDTNLIKDIFLLI